MATKRKRPGRPLSAPLNKPLVWGGSKEHLLSELGKPNWRSSESQVPREIKLLRIHLYLQHGISPTDPNADNALVARLIIDRAPGVLFAKRPGRPSKLKFDDEADLLVLRQGYRKSDPEISNYRVAKHAKEHARFKGYSVKTLSRALDHAGKAMPLFLACLWAAANPEAAQAVDKLCREQNVPPLMPGGLGQK